MEAAVANCQPTEIDRMMINGLKGNLILRLASKISDKTRYGSRSLNWHVNPIKSFLDDARWEAEDPHLLIDLTDFSHVRARQSVFRLDIYACFGSMVNSHWESWLRVRMADG